jgi:hypothetical protein
VHSDQKRITYPPYWTQFTITLPKSQETNYLGQPFGLLAGRPHKRCGILHWRLSKDGIGGRMDARTSLRWANHRLAESTAR